jgi:hypothetical protein
LPRIIDVNIYSPFKNAVGENWIFICKRIKFKCLFIRPLSYTIHKIQLKIIKNINVKAESMNFLRDNIRENLHDIDPAIGFLNMIPKAQWQSEIRHVGLYQPKNLHREGNNQQGARAIYRIEENISKFYIS